MLPYFDHNIAEYICAMALEDMVLPETHSTFARNIRAGYLNATNHFVPRILSDYLNS
jgi:hypothetical protein